MGLGTLPKRIHNDTCIVVSSCHDSTTVASEATRTAQRAGTAVPDADALVVILISVMLRRRIARHEHPVESRGCGSHRKPLSSRECQACATASA